MAADLSDEKKTAEQVTLTMEEKEAAETLTKDAANAADTDGPLTREIDIHNRDPNHMNDHIRVRFSDVIAEPDQEVFSFDKVWELSFKVFTITKVWCYRITSVVLALPLAVCWGCYFACVAFCTAWVCVPCLRSGEVECACIRKLWQLLVNTFLSPCIEAYARCFSNCRLRLIKEEA